MHYPPKFGCFKSDGVKALKALPLFITHINDFWFLFDGPIFPDYSKLGHDPKTSEREPLRIAN